MKNNQKLIATINSKAVSVINSDGTELVPIKPICEIFGIDTDSQRKKIQSDEILSSTTVLSTAVGADGKQREMFCLPLRYVFGWLFTINPSNVKEEAREAVIQYKRECYDVLYDYFEKYRKFVVHRQAYIEEQLDVVAKIRNDFRTTKATLHKAEAELISRRQLTLEDYDSLIKFDDFDQPLAEEVM